ncbi:hypothetical protein [Streptomyces sp. NPDC001889]
MSTTDHADAVRDILADYGQMDSSHESRLGEYPDHVRDLDTEECAIRGRPVPDEYLDFCEEDDACAHEARDFLARAMSRLADWFGEPTDREATQDGYNDSNSAGRDLLPKCLLDEALDALRDVFAKRGLRAASVSFLITETDSGLSWNPDGPLLASADGAELPGTVNLSGTPVADALDGITAFTEPRFGDTLRFQMEPRVSHDS